MRTFIAVSFSKEYEKYVKSIQKQLKSEDLKFIEPSNVHLTLHYLGEIDFKQMHKVNSIFEEVLKDIKPFILTTGYFDSFKKGTKHIAYQRIEIGEDDLSHLFEVLRIGLKKNDLPYHESFNPHITYARKVKDMLLFQKLPYFQPFEVIDKVTLFLSHSNKGKLEYLPLIEYTLK